MGRHRYLYRIVHWDHTQLTAFSPGQSRRELQTSQITLRFVGGGRLTTMVDHQRPAVANPWNSPYWLRGNPPAINVHKPQLLFATVVAVRPEQVVLQYRWNRLVTATVWTTARTTTWLNGRDVAYQQALSVTVGESVVVQTAPADAGPRGHAIAQTIYGNAAGPYINGIVSRVTGPVITIAQV